MKKLLTLCSVVITLVAHAQVRYGIQLFDMHKTEAVFIMTTEQVQELKAEISEEKRFFKKAFNEVKREWDKTYAAAVKSGDKTFPKFPTKTFIWERSFKSKTFSSEDAANEWYAKQKRRVDAAMAARAEEIKNAKKAAKGEFTRGYSSRDDKKARKKAAKADMDVAMKEKMSEMIMLKLSEMLEYNRPIPVHFIYDPIAGAEEVMLKQIKKQDEAIAAYKERKAAGATEEEK
jgi:hypothetical protein